LNLPMRNNYMEAAKLAVLAPSIRGWSEFRTEMWETCQSMFIGDITPEKAADLIIEKANDILW